MIFLSESKSMIEMWTQIFPRLIPMNQKPRSFLVSGWLTKSLKHQARYVSNNKVTSLKVSRLFANLVAIGMNHCR